MDLFERCRPHARLAIVGTAKNVGKTTCLNWLIESYEAVGLRLGLTSVGRDGEDLDQVTDLPKPRITPPPGTLVATATTSARRSSARLKELRATPFRTAIGPVSIFRVEDPGEVEIAGPVTVRDTAMLNAMLSDLGADRVLIDGAIDRRASASAKVADAVILATGMAAGDSPEEVAETTAMHLRWLSIPQAADCPSETGALTPNGFVPWPSETPLNEDMIAWLPGDATALVLSGAFTEGLAARLMTMRRSLDIIVPDGTHLLAGNPGRELERRGFRFFAAKSIRVLATTVNPTTPYGSGANPKGFLDLMRSRLAPTPVFDLKG